MRKLHPCIAVFLFAFALAAMSAAAVQGPYALLHSIFDPGTNAQERAGQGFSVAVDGNVAVAGAPFDDLGSSDSGVVKGYNATIASLLHTLVNPTPEPGESYGSA